MAKLIQKSSKILLAIALCMAVMFTVSYYTRGRVSAQAVNSEDWQNFSNWESALPQNHALIGVGTVSNPYQIEQAEDLAYFSKNYQNFKNTYLELVTNIDMNGALFTPIAEFDGDFSGNGYVIKNLFINSAEDNTGLFAATSETAKIKDLGIFGGKINSTKNYVGAIAGINRGEITGVFNTAEIKAEQDNIGGLVGANYGSISNSFNSGNVNTQRDFVGGIVGKNYDGGIVSFCYSLGEIGGNVKVGGIIGDTHSSGSNNLQYSYFNNATSANKGLKAIGSVGGNNMPIDIAPPTGNQFKGMGAADFESKLSNIGFTSNKWVKKYTANDASAYYAPALSAFIANADDIMKDAVIIRLYGSEGSVGWGTDANPYLISNIDQYLHLAATVNGGITYAQKSFMLTQDLDFTDKTEMPTIGTAERKFNGMFDGNNHIISSLVIDRSAAGSVTEAAGSYVGMFGNLGESATVKNLTIADSCRFIGTKNIGSIAGVTYGTISNVESRAEVKGSRNVGGIAGESISAKFINILSCVTLGETANDTAAYGIVGAATGFNQTNAWYLAQYGAKFNDTKGWGSIMRVDRNGGIVATKTTIGKITFDNKNTDPSWELEYRDDQENKVENGSIYTTNANNTASITVHARFVKDIIITPLQAEEGIAAGGGKFYEGQDIALEIGVNDGYYLKDILGNFNRGGTQVSEIMAAKHGYSDGKNTAIVRMTRDLSSIEIDIENIASEAIQDRAYDGTASDYTFELEGYDIITSYSTGKQPSAAGTYTVTITLNQNNARRGQKRIPFTITPRQLTMPDGNISKQKQYDNITNPSSSVAEVSQDGINIVSGDDVTVTAISFFADAEIGTNKNATFTFSLSGKDSGNYIAPTSVTFGDCEITKRVLTFEIEDKWLNKVYDGNVSAVENFGIISGNKPVFGKDAAPKIWFSKESDPTVSVDAINAGMYILNIESGSEDGRQYYILKFKEIYLFEVKPLAVAVNITDYNNLVYDTLAKNVGGWFINELNKKVTISTADSIFSYERLINGTYVLDSTHTNAGEYRVSAVLSGNYTVDTTKNDEGKFINVGLFSVSKAEQPNIQVNTIADSVLTYGDPDRTLTFSGGAPESSDVYFSIVSGFAQIKGNAKNQLSFTGGGTIVITVTKAQTENYFEIVSAEYTIEVVKPTLTITLGDTHFVYGTLITELPFVFDGYISADSGLTVPTGFVMPTITINGAPLDKTKLYNASDIAYALSVGSNAFSNGYVFNYEHIASKLISLFIDKKDITVKLDDKDITYGDKDVPLTYTIEDAEFLLVGNPEREVGANAASYNITKGTITAEANPNFNITFIEGTYRISQKELIITVIGKQKIFGEKDPIPDFSVAGLVNSEKISDIVKGSILRAAGEDAFNVGSTNPYGYYLYLASGLTINANYSLTFKSAALRILPKEPKFDAQNDIFIQYGDALKTARPVVTVDGGINGTFAWITPNIIPDFTSSPTLRFTAQFTPSSKNYTAATLELIVTVIAREITVKFSGDTDLIYNGLLQKNITYVLNNVLDGDVVNSKLIYSGDVKNAGDYTATVSIANNNYIIVGDADIAIKVKKAALLIYLEDIVLPEDAVPQKNFIYEGFVNGETAAVLTAQPDVNFNTAVGNYTITPFGASASNYSIKYKSSNQLVTKTKLTSDLQDFKLSGNFNYLMEMMLKEIKSSDNKAKFTTLKELYETIKTDKLSTTKLMRLYQISFTIQEEEAHLTGTARATMTIPSRLAEAKILDIVLIKADGTMVYASNVQRDGNTVSFDIEDCVNIGIVTPPDYTYIIIGVVILVLIIAVFALDMVSEKLGIGRHSEKSKAKKNAKKSK